MLLRAVSISNACFYSPIFVMRIRSGGKRRRRDVRRIDRGEFHQGAGDGLALDVADDEDQPGAAIRRRPAIEPRWRVEDVLHAMQHERSLRLVRDMHEPLEAQQVLALQRSDIVEPAGEGVPLDRLVDDEAEGLDAVMAMHVAM